MNQYKIIIIDSIWDSIEHPFTKKYLPKLFQTKKIGYSQRHADTYLPLAMEDIVANHILICKRIDEEYEPICISKVALSTQIKKYGLDDPLIHYMKGTFSDDYTEHAHKSLKRYHCRQEETAYSGGFTINRLLLDHKQEIEHLKELYCAVHTHLLIDRGVHACYGFACPRMKTDLLFGLWGFTPFLLDGKYEQAAWQYAQGEEIMLIWSEIGDLTAYAKEMADKYEYLWHERIDTKYSKEPTPCL